MGCFNAILSTSTRYCLLQHGIVCFNTACSGTRAAQPGVRAARWGAKSLSGKNTITAEIQASCKSSTSPHSFAHSFATRARTPMPVRFSAPPCADDRQIGLCLLTILALTIPRTMRAMQLVRHQQNAQDNFRKRKSQKLAVCYRQLHAGCSHFV